jgi:hypothetical protein
MVIDGALKALDDSYIFPEVAKKMAAAIRARQKAGEYDAISSGRDFAQRLTDHLREVSRDKHLTVGVNPMRQSRSAAERRRLARHGRVSHQLLDRTAASAS